jgi:FkbM family methyltransferase
MFTLKEASAVITGRVLERINVKRRKLAYSPKSWVTKNVKPCQNTIKLGTKYGGWNFIPTPYLSGSHVILCGAGEDISFDIEMQRRYDTIVVIVDPTPRAIAHYEEVKAAAISGRHCPINHSAKNFYDFTSVDLSKIQYIDKALWFERTTVKFWVPRNEAHVSHSIINYQETAKFIQVETITMNDVIRAADIDVVNLSLVKLDIEGAEIEVIHDMLNNNIMPRQLLVEFDEMNKPNARSSGRIKGAIYHLLEKGYILNFYDGRANCSFVLKQ